jgi:ABC-type iron transport system FetAB permease component
MKKRSWTLSFSLAVALVLLQASNASCLTQYSITNATDTPTGSVMTLDARWSVFKIRAERVSVDVDGFTNTSIPGIAGILIRNTLDRLGVALSTTIDEIVYYRGTVKTIIMAGSVEQAYRGFYDDPSITLMEFRRCGKILLSRSRCGAGS